MTKPQPKMKWKLEEVKQDFMEWGVVSPKCLLCLKQWRARLTTRKSNKHAPTRRTDLKSSPRIHRRKRKEKGKEEE